MILIKTMITLFTFIAISCSSTSKTTTATDNENDMNKVTMNEKKMMEAGFTRGTIVYSDEAGDCPYTIEVQINDNMTYFDPIDLDEKYKEDGIEVWFKYGPLRMMNRCEKANPVSIVEMINKA